MHGTTALFRRLRAIESRLQPLLRPPAVMMMLAADAEHCIGEFVAEVGGVSHPVTRCNDETFGAFTARVEAQLAVTRPLTVIFLRPLHAAPLEEDETR